MYGVEKFPETTQLAQLSMHSTEQHSIVQLKYGCGTILVVHRYDHCFGISASQCGHFGEAYIGDQVAWWDHP